MLILIKNAKIPKTVIKTITALKAYLIGFYAQKITIKINSTT